MIYDYAAVGGGIIGLATAFALTRRRPGAAILVLEKEPGWGLHQSGHNSGVIHSGIYYRPGSLKAQMAVAGNGVMRDFCAEHAIPHRITGKLVVACNEPEVPRLRQLHDNARANGVEAVWLDALAARRFEPHVAAVAALHVPSTGVVDYRRVTAKLVELLSPVADLRSGCAFLRSEEEKGLMILDTSTGVSRAHVLVNCAGLFSDRVARAAGERSPVRIVPFRGEYYDVTGPSGGLVRALVYPVPDPSFPFLGVHITRGIELGVHAGPNAVLAFAREGYRWRDVRPRDLIDTLTYRGFWRLASRYWDEGAREVWRSISKERFASSVRRLVPEIATDDLHRSSAGVRAQALTLEGELADDFVIVLGRRSVHVCNAPSPGATASLVIGRHVAEQAIAIGDGA